MYSEINEWQGKWSRILAEFFIFMLIYTFGSAVATTILTDANGNTRYGLVIDVVCLIYFALALWLFVRYRFTKFRYCIEGEMFKVYKVIGKSQRLLLNVEKDCIHKIEIFDSKDVLKEYGPLMNYCVVDKMSKKYVCALEYEDKKYRFVFQPTENFLKFIADKA